MKKLKSILDNEKAYLTAFWLVLAGVAVYFSYLTAIDWTEAMSIDKWPETDCEIIESRVEEEGGQDWADLFIVAYQYEWSGEIITANVYGSEYNGESYYPAPNTLVGQYPIGSQTKCYVNPENPTQAVLEKESTLTIFFLLFLVVLFMVSVTKLFATWNKNFAARLKGPPQTAFEAFLRVLWKPIKWVVITIGVLLGISVGLWALIGLAGILFIFIGFPLLFAKAMTEQMEEVGDELLKLQLPEEGGFVSKSSKPKLNFTFLEKGIIAIAVIAFVFVMSFFIRHNKGVGMWAIFGVMFNAMWFGGVISILTYAILRGMREYQKKRSKQSTVNISKKPYYPPGIRIMKLATGILALVGIGGFLAGFVCAFSTMSGEPRVSSWARFPLGDLESIAVDSGGNIYCGANFYSRIQAYSPEGKFIRGWFLDAGGGVFRIKIDEADNLHVGTARGDQHYIFSTEGELISAKEMSPKEEERVFGKTYNAVTADGEGNIYEVRNGILLPRVVKTDARGEKSVVVSDPFVLWFIKGPLPAWLWIAVAILLNMRLERHKVPWHKPR